MPIPTLPPPRPAAVAGVMTTLEGAFALYGVSRNELITAVDAGEIIGVLDVSAGSGQTRRELRLPTTTLAEWTQALRKPRTNAELAALVFGEVNARLGTIRRRHVRRMLNVSDDLLTDLLKLPGSRGLRLKDRRQLGRHSHAGSSPLIRWDELVRWMGVRRLDGEDFQKA